MMKQVRTIELTHAAPIDGRSHGRTPAVQLRINERDALIRAAARFYPGASEREIARRLHFELSKYRNGRFRRDQAEYTCPAPHRGKLVELLYCMLRVQDRVPSEVTFRRAVSSPDPAGVL
jgi:hypothetical protein